MKKQIFVFLIPIFFLFFIDTKAFAQLSVKNYAKKDTSLDKISHSPFRKSIQKNKFSSILSDKSEKIIIPKAYNYNNLAFFCKLEIKLEQSAKFPIKFRLGDVNYVDFLEQK